MNHNPRYNSQQSPFVRSSAQQTATIKFFLSTVALTLSQVLVFYTPIVWLWLPANAVVFAILSVRYRVFFGFCSIVFIASAYWALPTATLNPIVHPRRAPRLEIDSIVRGDPRRPAMGELRVKLVDPPIELSLPDLPWHPAASIQAGDRIEATAVLSRHWQEEGLFTFAAYLRRQGLLARAWSEEVRRVEKSMERATVSPLLALAGIPPEQSTAVLLAVTIGTEDLLGKETIELFRRTGLSHFLVISGFHIGLAFIVIYTSVSWLLSRSTLMVLFLPVRRIAVLVAAAAAFLYAVETGLGISTFRALVAVGVSAVSYCISRKSDRVRALIAAGWLVTLVWPGAFLDVGCQLTFAAVAGIISVTATQKPRPETLSATCIRWAQSAALVSVAAWAWTLPVSLAWFSCISPLSVPFNIVFVPLFSLVYVLMGGVALSLYSITPSVGSELVRFVSVLGDLMLQLMIFFDDHTKDSLLGMQCFQPRTAKVLSAFWILAGLLLWRWKMKGRGPNQVARSDA